MTYEYEQYTPQELSDSAAERVEHYETRSLGTQEVRADDLAALWRAIGSLASHASGAGEDPGDIPATAAQPETGNYQDEQDYRDYLAWKAARDNADTQPITAVNTGTEVPQ